MSKKEGSYIFTHRFPAASRSNTLLVVVFVIPAWPCFKGTRANLHPPCPFPLPPIQHVHLSAKVQAPEKPASHPFPVHHQNNNNNKQRPFASPTHGLSSSTNIFARIGHKNTFLILLHGPARGISLLFQLASTFSQLPFAVCRGPSVSHLKGPKIYGKCAVGHYWHPKLFPQGPSPLLPPIHPFKCFHPGNALPPCKSC